MATVAGGLNGGSIDGGVVSPPSSSPWRSWGYQGADKHHDMGFCFFPSVFSSRRNDSQKPPRGYQPIYARLCPGHSASENDRAFTYKSMANYTKIQDTTVLQKAYDLYIGKVLEKAPYINMVGMQNAWRIWQRRFRRQKREARTVIDHRFLDNLDKSGLLRQLITYG